MKFNYLELETETYNSQRWYFTPNGVMPSITTVLGHTEAPEKIASLENWRNSLGHEEADRVSEQAREHGTNVHLLIERFLKKEQVDAPINDMPVPALDLAAFNAMKLKLRKIDTIWGQEVALYSDTLEVAGRCDLVGVYEGKPAIIDFKTSRKIKTRADIGDYNLQLCFYSIAHNEVYGTDIQDGVILMVAETGFPLEFRVHLPDHYAELKRRVQLFWTTVLGNIEKQ